jgi:hypothetical protein
MISLQCENSNLAMARIYQTKSATRTRNKKLLKLHARTLGTNLNTYFTMHKKRRRREERVISLIFHFPTPTPQVKDFKFSFHFASTFLLPHAQEMRRYVQ